MCARKYGGSIMIKRLGKEDVETLYGFLTTQLSNDDRELFKPHSFKKEDLTRILGSANVYVGYFEGEQMAGYGLLRFHRNFKYPMVGVAVSKNHRGKGIGSQIIQYFISTSKVDIIKCKVYADNPASLALFKKLGFQFKVYEWIGEHRRGTMYTNQSQESKDKLRDLRKTL